MAEAENPLIPVQAKVARIHARLLEFFRSVLIKIKPVMMSLKGFLVNLKKSAKEIGQTVGKAAVDSVIKAGQKLLQIVAFVEKNTIVAIKMATKMLAFIKKSMKFPEKVFKAVRAMVARLAKVFRLIVTKVHEVMVILNPIETILQVIDRLKMMLQLIFKWITQVSGISNGVKKAKALIKKSVKMLKAEAKQVTELVKEVNKLKPA
ncbi:hypothetical protein [Tateyamaria sp.]|jgi:hypothetical protein|uniref:hypothetical protein n=1 Tax=Tateyamaria sp. TaxID=1929288 RepID=UPI0039B9B592